MGMISKIIGIIFAAAGALIVVFGMEGSDPTLQYVWFFIGLLLVSMGLSLITGGRKQVEHEPPPPTVTEIHCDNPECDFKEIRQFESGDYVLKPVDVKCPKCSSKMTIQGVYVVKEDKPEDKIDI
ncbi:MAG: hypothetical protein ACFFED_06145 [Candidatus Thorarchaeota archaeon]